METLEAVRQESDYEKKMYIECKELASLKRTFEQYDKGHKATVAKYTNELFMAQRKIPEN